jgi:hypothetical protein
MNTWNPKQMSSAPATAAVLAMPAEPAGANKEGSAPARVKGTLHARARTSRPDDGPASSGR